ncbi:MAG: hypothetical protein J4F34_07245 [Gemmatimonadetes bacterium]|nr:hypothetical protein [Gemmatimonadota bacterium]
MASTPHGAGGTEGQSTDMAARTNELYWSSDASVNRLARELSLSKGALYRLVAPLSAGLPCPRCGAEMGYSNRTTRDRGLVSCAECGLEDEYERIRAYRPAEGEGEIEGGVGLSLAKLVVVSAIASAAVAFLLSAALRKRTREHDPDGI